MSEGDVMLAGVVLGPDKKPFRGAALAARGPAALQDVLGTAESGPDGRFALQVPAAAFPLRLHANGAGCLEAVADLALDGDQDALTIRLKALPAIVRGRAVEVNLNGAALAPIANAEVYCAPASPASNVYTNRFVDKERYGSMDVKSLTDASGAFEIAVEGTREPLVVLLGDPWLQWREWPMVVLDGPEPDVVLVQALRGLEVKVSARLANGEDLPEPANLVVYRREGGKHLKEKTLKPGTSVSLYLPPGDYSLLCGCRSGSVQLQGRADLTLAEGCGATELCITLERTEPRPPRFREVRGQICDTQGKPMSPRELGVAGDDLQMELSVKKAGAEAPIGQSRVAMDGSFTVSVPVAVYDAGGLSVELRIGEFVTQAPVPADGSEVRLVVPREALETGFASLTVDVVASASREAVGSITLLSRGDGRWIRALADEKGRTVIRGLAGGQYELVVAPKGFGIVRQRVVMAARQDKSIVVEVPSTVIVECEIVRWEAAGAGDVMIALIAAGDAQGAGVQWLRPVGEGGHCVFPNLVPGRYWAVATGAAGFGKSEVRAWPVMGQTIVVDERPVQKVTLACRWEQSAAIEMEVVGGAAAPQGALSLEFVGAAGEVLGAWILELPLPRDDVRTCLPAGTSMVRFGACGAAHFVLFPCGEMGEQSLPVGADGRCERVSIDLSAAK
ncbi:MAG: carboxypeptidase regulatory-like domain-containing protein [Planctomycetes bacterium]|nr:carboxypeptidase regulatory-like domain-containing protein [Planctomycetota bacterium]